MNRIIRSLSVLLLPLALVLSPGTLEAQTGDGSIVSHQVTVAAGAAALELEFRDGRELSLEFRDGQILVSGSVVGSYRAGDELESAWRILLGRAVALDNGDIGQLLLEWAPPAGLDDDAAGVARTIQERLLAELERETDTPPLRRVDGGDQAGDVLAQLLTRPEWLRALTGAVGDLAPRDLRVHVGESVRIAPEDRVAASFLGLESDFQVDGQIEGDVILLGGSIVMGSEGAIDGRLRWFDAEGAEKVAERVSGGVARMDPVPARPEATLRDEIRREVEAALEAGERARDRSAAPPSRVVVSTGTGERGFFRNVGRGIAQVLQTVVTFGILLALGLVTLHFFPRHFEIVARTARNAPGRSGLVGLASGILAFPVWIAGVVLLAVTIIGIPVMLLWIPLFPLALMAAGTLGFLAVSRNAGSWLGRRGLQGLDSLDGPRPAMQVAAGLVLLLGLFAVAGIFRMGGAWFSIFQGVVTFAGVLLVVITGTVGLGAVVLSRGGRDPLYAGSGWAWGGSDPWDDDEPPTPPSGTPRPQGGGPGSPPPASPGAERQPDPEGSPSNES